MWGPLVRPLPRRGPSAKLHVDGHVYGELAQIHPSSMAHHDPLKQLQQIHLLASNSPQGRKYVGPTLS